MLAEGKLSTLVYIRRELSDLYCEIFSVTNGTLLCLTGEMVGGVSVTIIFKADVACFESYFFSLFLDTID